MKYIRTKDGKIFHYQPTGDYQIIGEMIYKQSDDLKELFDGYYLDIDNHPFNTTRIFSHNELKKALSEKVYWQNYSDGKGLEYEINLYAFIKTDRGLIYVARMNDNGELELL